MSTAAERIMRRARGEDRGWTGVRFGWDTAPDGGVPQIGWWAATPDGPIYLGRTTREVLDACAPSTPRPPPVRAL